MILTIYMIRSLILQYHAPSIARLIMIDRQEYFFAPCAFICCNEVERECIPNIPLLSKQEISKSGTEACLQLELGGHTAAQTQPGICNAHFTESDDSRHTISACIGYNPAQPMSDLSYCCSRQIIPTRYPYGRRDKK